MAVDLSGRNFLKEADFEFPAVWPSSCSAAELKAAKKSGTERPTMVGKNIALILEKTSMRTRCSFEVGAHDQGAHVTYLDPGFWACSWGTRSRWRTPPAHGTYAFDGIEYRGFGQSRVQTLADYAGCRCERLTDEWHPTQMLPTRSP